MDIPEEINQESPTKERLTGIALRLMYEHGDASPLGMLVQDTAVIGAPIEYVERLEKRIG